MIGSVATSKSFQKTTRYVSRERSQPVYGNFPAAAADDPMAIARVMDSTAQQSDRVQKPCYHISISPSRGDELSKDDWANLTEDFLEGMGLEDKQAVGWLHEDEEFPDGTPRPHLHLVVNRVGALGKTYDTSWDYRKVDSVLRGLEEDYGLDAVTPAAEVDVKRDTPGQVHRIAAEQGQYENPKHPRTEPPKPSERSQIQRAIEEAIDEANSTAGIADFLSRQGINTRITERGWSFEKDGVAFAGSQLGRRYSMKSVEQTMVNSQENPPQEEGDKGLEKRQKQRSLTMQQVMQDTSDARNAGREFQREARNVSSLGQRTMQQTQEVDGTTIIGGALALAGTAAEIGSKFSQRLDQARERAESDRAIGQLNKLEEIGERTEALETKVRQAAAPEAPSENPEQLDTAFDEATYEDADGNLQWRPTDQEQAATEQLLTDIEENSSSPSEQSFKLANERLTKLGEQLGVEIDDADPVEFDPSAPVGKQLDQMDAAISQLDDRLGTLEDAVKEMPAIDEEMPAINGADVDVEADAAAVDDLPFAALSRPELDNAPAVGEAEIDEVDDELNTPQSLENFIQARTQFRGETEPSPFTSSAGTVELTSEGFQGQDSRLTITDPDYGTVLEATKSADGQWQTQIDELEAEQAETIDQLPQSAEEYGQYKQGQQMIDSLQRLPQTANEFEGDRGRVNWKSSGSSYRFDIERQEDGSQRVMGQNADGEAVFSATVSDNSVVVNQNDIPAEESNELFAQREQELTPPEEDNSQGITLGVQSNPTQRRELEL